jgi:hypothetical protein
MKRLLLIFLFLIILQTASAQLVYDTETKVFKVEKVLSFDSLNKEVIYSKTKAWLAEHFKSAKDVITAEVPSEGLITGRYTASYPYSLIQLEFMHQMKIQIKDGKAKFLVSNMETTQYNYPADKYYLKKDGTYPHSTSKKLYEAMQAGIESTIKSYQDYVLKKEKSDW